VFLCFDMFSGSLRSKCRYIYDNVINMYFWSILKQLMCYFTLDNPLNKFIYQNSLFHAIFYLTLILVILVDLEIGTNLIFLGQNFFNTNTSALVFSVYIGFCLIYKSFCISYSKNLYRSFSNDVVKIATDLSSNFTLGLSFCLRVKVISNL